MLFTTLIYLFFLCFTIGITYSLPLRARIPWLLLASYAFYIHWKPAYALIIIALTVINYGAALAIHRKFVWTAAVLANLGVLFVFKYLGFFAHEWNEWMAWLGAGGPVPVAQLLLPLGISFHTLQAIAYVTDVRRGVIPAERNLLRFALFISWFPQMIAGPIERGARLLPQLKDIRKPEAATVGAALSLILYGFFKKLVLADNLAPMVNTVFSAPAAFPTWQNWFVVYGFGFQLYFDFSAYMDIATGSSLLFGVRLSENFHTPFLSASLPEFWRRWHITLTSWFFEYVYYPLVRRFSAGPGPVFAILVVFFLSGLWHGANRTFLLWGMVHGLLLCISIYFPGRVRIPHILRVAITFNLVCLCWVLFRSESLGQAYEVYSSLLGMGESGTRSLWPGARFRVAALFIAGSTAAVLWAIPPHTKAAAWAATIWLTAITLCFGEFASHTFVYFQF